MMLIVISFIPCHLFIANAHTSCLACSSETKMLFDISNMKYGKNQDDWSVRFAIVINQFRNSNIFISILLAGTNASHPTIIHDRGPDGSETGANALLQDRLCYDDCF